MVFVTTNIMKQVANKKARESDKAKSARKKAAKIKDNKKYRESDKGKKAKNKDNKKYRESDKAKKYRESDEGKKKDEKKYRKSDKGKKAKKKDEKKYRKSDKGKKAQKEYNKKYNKSDKGKKATKKAAAKYRAKAAAEKLEKREKENDWVAQEHQEKNPNSTDPLLRRAAIEKEVRRIVDTELKSYNDYLLTDRGKIDGALGDASPREIFEGGTKGLVYVGVTGRTLSEEGFEFCKRVCVELDRKCPG